MKKGYPSNSLPKTSVFVFAWDSLTFKVSAVPRFIFCRDSTAIPRKNKIKVFGKGSGEEPFFRKVFPSDRHKYSIPVSVLSFRGGFLTSYLYWGTPFIVSDILPFATSTESTFTLTICPTLTTSRGCFMNLSASCDICTSPSS